MYLSRLILNPRDRRVRHDIADCQELHRTLLSVFPQAGGDGARAEFGLLYRLEIEPRSGAARVLVQSREAADWGRLGGRYLLGYETKDVAAAYAALQPGARLRFRLRANPTRRIGRGNDVKDPRWIGKRVDLRGEEEQLAWLQRKGREQCGFLLGQARVSAPEASPLLASERAVPALTVAGPVANVRTRPEATLHGHRGGARLSFGSVTFDGELRVTDVGAFRAALIQGIGSGKAYGFGLLSIAPVRGEA